MKLTRIDWLPRVTISYTSDDLYVLETCSKAHYDGKCQSASKLGGVLHGMRNTLNYSDDACPEVSLTVGDLGLLMKICEAGEFLGIPVGPAAMVLSMGFSKILVGMQSVQPESHTPGDLTKDIT